MTLGATPLLEGRFAVITGASRGIGRAIAESFCAQGANVIASARVNTDDFHAWAKQLNITPFALDLADEDSIKSAIKSIRTAAPQGIDILVNNAGAPHGALFQMTRLADLREVFEVNLFGQIAFTQGLVRLMGPKKGVSENSAIINMASTAAMIADPGTLAYGASKAAFTRATESMATELGPQGIRVNAIAPGVTKTDMLDDMDPTAVEKLVASSALKKVATPEDIANAALVLASDLSTHITGQILRVDGGII